VRLAFAAAFAVGELGLPPLTPADAVALGYAAFSLVVVLVAMRRPLSRLHADLPGVDLLAAALFTVVGHLQIVHFFPLFVLVSTAYRRGVGQTVATGLVLASVLALDSHPAVVTAFGGAVSGHTAVLAAYTLVVAVLVAHLAYRERGARGEAAALGLLFEHVRLDAGPVVSSRSVLDVIRTIFHARQVLLAVDNTADDASVLWRTRLATGGQAAEPIVERLAPADRANCWFPVEGPASACLLSRSSSGTLRATAAVDPLGNPVAPPRLCPRTFADRHAASQIIVLPSLTVGAFRLRVFVLDPRMDRPVEQLRLLQTVAGRIAPVIYNLFLERRLRTRLQENERAKLARELHDGVIQSLIGIEMRLEVARRQIQSSPARAETDLRETQLHLREQIVDVRTLMNQLRPPDVDRTRLMDMLSETTERFHRTTGIEAQFERSVDHLRLPKRVCRELVRVVDEALMNVRKHSGASRVAVRVGARAGDITLSIEDDGRGFGFAGRMTQPDLDALGLGPLVIKERVQSIGGRVAIDSRPGMGARLEVQVPTAPHG
jgi:signal transduction histidine kinase